MSKDDINCIFDLNDLTIEINRSLKAYEALFSPYITFGGHEPLKPVPGKGYSARTTIPVFYDKEPAGTLHAIMFRFRDGTGDESTFKAGQLELPDYLKDIKNPKKILPRAKTGVHVEALFPFFTAIGKNRYIPHVVSLEELTVDDLENPRTIVKAGDLGLSRKEHSLISMRACLDSPDESWSLSKNNPEDLPLFLTCGYQDGKRFGDPHAIYCATKIGAQIVGFLATKEQNGLSMLLEKYGKKAA